MASLAASRKPSAALKGSSKGEFVARLAVGRRASVELMDARSKADPYSGSARDDASSIQMRALETWVSLGIG